MNRKESGKHLRQMSYLSCDALFEVKENVDQINPLEVAEFPQKSIATALDTFESSKTDTESYPDSDSEITVEEEPLIISNLLKILGLKIKIQIHSVSSQSSQLLESLSQLSDFQRPPRLVVTGL